MTIPPGLICIGQTVPGRPTVSIVAPPYCIRHPIKDGNKVKVEIVKKSKPYTEPKVRRHAPLKWHIFRGKKEVITKYRITNIRKRGRNEKRFVQDEITIKEVI